jgi:hypothetical protein
MQFWFWTTDAGYFCDTAGTKIIFVGDPSMGSVGQLLSPQIKTGWDKGRRSYNILLPREHSRPITAVAYACMKVRNMMEITNPPQWNKFRHSIETTKNFENETFKYSYIQILKIRANRTILIARSNTATTI